MPYLFKNPITGEEFIANSPQRRSCPITNIRLELVGEIKSGSVEEEKKEVKKETKKKNAGNKKTKA